MSQKREQTSEILKKRLTYEKMLADISLRTVTVEDINEFLDECMQILGKTIDVSRIYIFEHQYGTDTAFCIFEWVAPGTVPSKRIFQGLPLSGFPWWLSMMKKNQVIMYRDIEEIPGEREKEVLSSLGIKSILAVPLYTGKTYYGFMGFDERRRYRDWRDEEVYVLKAAAQIIGATIRRKQAEEALRGSENKYRAIFENTGTATIIIEEDMTISLANREFEKISGYSRGELEGTKKWPIFFKNEDVGRMQEYHRLRRIDPKAAPRNYETHFFDKQGSVKDIFMTVGIIPETKKSVASFLDITGRKRAEEELLAAHQKFQDIINFLPDATFVIDQNRQVITWNRAMEEVTGVRKEDIIGRDHYARAIHNNGEPALVDFIEMKDPDLRKHNINRKKETLSKDGFLPGAYGGKGAYFRGVALPLYDKNGGFAGAIESLHDITEIRNVENQLHQAQKTEAVGLLAGGVAHDFNNLLTGVLGNVSTILADLPPDHVHVEALREVEQAASVAAEIVKKLLGFSRKTIIKYEIVNINNTICETCKIIKRTADPRVTIKIGLAEDLWLVKADKTQIVQILMNLCINALDAMPVGGAIILETENVAIGDDYLHTHMYARPGNFVKFSVSDTGCGMMPEVKDRIFEPFFTTKETGHGTGLGLPMVYGIVKQQEGWIECYSEAGAGTRFAIYLPATSGSVTLPVHKAAAVAAPDLSGSETILIVDDKKLVRNFARRVLLMSGYKTMMACDGMEAVEIYRSEWNNIDLVVLDMTMPKLSGKDTMAVLREINPSVKVLFSSGYSLNGLSGLLLSEREFIQKPYRASDLLLKIRQMLDS